MLPKVDTQTHATIIPMIGAMLSSPVVIVTQEQVATSAELPQFITVVPENKGVMLKFHNMYRSLALISRI